MLKRSLLVLGMVVTGASADFSLTYESDVDLDPNNGDIIDIAPNDSATISIWAWPGSTTELYILGFNFNGVDNGGTLEFEYISLSNFAWDPVSFFPNGWYAGNTLPYPRTTNFVFYAIPIPVEGLLLATLQVNLGSDLGRSDVSTGPEFWDGIPAPVVAIGDAFSVNVIPEPATLALLVLGGVAVMRRRRRTAANA